MQVRMYIRLDVHSEYVGRMYCTTFDRKLQKIYYAGFT